MLAGTPWERIGIDLTCRHPRTRWGNYYLLTYVDYFTKFVEVYAIPNKEAETVFRVLAEEVFPRHGVPLQVMTDQGSELENQLLRDCATVTGLKTFGPAPTGRTLTTQ